MATNSTTGLNVNINVNSQNAVQGLEKINIAIIAIGTATALITKKLSETAAEFDKDMRNVNSIAQETEQSYQKLYSKVRSLSDDPKIIDGPIKIAKGMYQLVSSGFDVSKSLDLVAEASKSASAGLTSTETAVTAVSALMNGYNQKTLQDGIKFNDQLFRVVDKGVVSFEQLATNLGSVIPIASAAGVSFEEVGAMFIELTRAGISASEAETSIAGVIKAISNPTPESLAWARQLGVDISELSIKTKGLPSVLKEMGEATKGSSSLMDKLIGDSRALKGALVLAGDGAKGFSRALGEMATSQGTRDKALEQQSKSAAFAYEKIKVSLEDLRIEYGKIINDAIVPMLKYLKDFIDYLKNLDQGTKETIVNVGLFTIALAGTLIAIQGVIYASKGLSIVWGLLEKHPIFLVLVGAAVFFYEIDKAVQALNNSTSIWGQTLHDTLDTINLFGKIKNFMGYLDAKGQNNIEEADKQKAIKTYDESYPEFKQKESSAKRDPKNKTGLLPLEDYKKELKILNEVYTFKKEIADNDNALDEKIFKDKVKILNQKMELGRITQQDYAEEVSKAKKEFDNKKNVNNQDFNIVKNEKNRLNGLVKLLGEEEKLEGESKKRKELDAAKFAKQQEASFKLSQKKEQELNELKKRLANDVKSINEKQSDELASLQKKDYEHNIFLAEKEKAHNKKTFDDALKLKVISQKEYNYNTAQSEKVFNAKLVKMQKDLSKTLTDEYNQATKNKYQLETIQADNDFKEKKDYLLSLKKLKIDTKAQEIQNTNIHNAKIKKIDEEQKKDKENDVVTVNQKWASATEMIAKMNEKMNLIGKSDSEKRAINFKKELAQQKKAIDDFILDMSKQKSTDGKTDLHSKDSIKKMRKSLEESFGNLKKGGDIELLSQNKLDKYSKDLSIIDDKLKELSKNPVYKNNIDFTPVSVINKEIEEYKNKKLLAEKFLHDNEKTLTAEEKAQKKREIRDYELEIENSQEKIKQIKIKALKDFTNVFKELSIFDNKSLDFMSDLIGKTDSLNKGLEKITKGHKAEDGTITTGLEGLMNFAKDGGDISGITAVFGQIVDKSKQMIAAVTDNVRAVRDAKDFGDVLGDIATQFGDVVGNMITLGLYSGIRKAIGIKAPKEIFEEQKKIKESDLKMNKDKEDVAIKTYNLQKELAFRTIKDEGERNQKLKELDFDLNNSLFALRKENFDLDIKLSNDKAVQIQKNYQIQKEEINQNEGNEELKTKKLLALEKDKNEKLFADKKENVDLDIKLTGDKTEQIKMFYQIEQENILNSEGNWEKRTKKLNVLFQETKQKMADQQADFEKMNAKLNSTNEIEKMIKEHQADMIKINAQNLTEEERKRQQLSLVQDLGIKLVDTQKQGWKDLETLMSGYYDKEAKLVKAKHKGDYDEIQIREQSIKSNQKQIDKMQSELDKIEAKFAKLLDNKTLSKAAKTEFDKRVSDMQLQEGGLNYNQLIRTPETEFNRKISAKKEDINAQYEIDGNLQAKSDALKNLAVEQNVYWNAISKNIVKGTKEYDESVRNQYNSFKEFKDAVKDGIDAQKDFEETNFKTTNGVVDLKQEISNLTDKNKQFTNEIKNYNNQIQSDLDILTSKFKNSAGEWETDLNKVRAVLSGITQDSATAINELNQVISKKMMVDNAVKKIIKDPTKAVTGSNINPSGWDNLPGSKTESNINTSNTDYKMPLTYQKTDNSIKAYTEGKISGESTENYINRIKKEDAEAQVKAKANIGIAPNTIDPFSKVRSNPLDSTLNWLSGVGLGMAKMVGMKTGGISDGPIDGYFQKLHGREAVINENQGDNLAYILRQANNPNSFINNTSSSYGGNTININGVGLSKNEILDVLVSFEEKREQNKRLAYRGSY